MTQTIDLAAFTEPPEEFGPKYPALPGLDKHRRLDRRVMDRDPEREREYGAAVHAAIRALQRSELMREVSVPKPNCASGTAHTSGAKILAAVRSQLEAKLRADANADRRRRTDAEISAAYVEAMDAKRAREGRPAMVVAPVVVPELEVESPVAAPEPTPTVRMRARKMPRPVAPGPNSHVIYYSTVKAPKAGRWNSYRVGRVIAATADGHDLSCTIGGGFDYQADALAMARVHAENLAANVDLFPAGAHIRMRKEAGGVFRLGEPTEERPELPLDFRREFLRQMPPPRSQAAWRLLSHMIRAVRRQVIEARPAYGDVQAGGCFYASLSEGSEPVRAGWQRWRMHDCETLRQIRTEPEREPVSYGRKRGRGFFDAPGTAPDRPSKLAKARAFLAARRGQGSGTGEGPVPLPDVGRPYVLGRVKPRIRVKAISRPHVAACEPAPVVAAAPPGMRVPLHLLASTSAVAYRAAA